MSKQTKKDIEASLAEQFKVKLEKKEKARKALALQNRYSQRITIAKQGREFFLNKDYTGASRKYHEYLNILAQVQEVDDIYKITPAKFDPESDMTEMLLVSHIFWELARIYEMTPKLQKAFHQNLAQFVRFTVNQPYQVLNSDVLRRYIKKNRNTSSQIEALEKAYSQIQTQSRKCFIATFLFGEEHWVTKELRLFKQQYLQGRWGAKVVGFYYQLSSPLIDWLQTKPSARIPARLAFQPIVAIIAMGSRAKRKFL